MSGRNDPCPCGSGKKYKKCCGQVPSQAQSAIPARTVVPNHSVARDDLTPLEINGLIALYNARKFSELESRARGLVTHHPNSGFLWKALSVSLQAQGKDALQALQKTATLLPSDAEAHTNLGVVQRERGMLDDALKSHRRALALNPQFAQAHFNLGTVLRDLGLFEDALASLRQAIAIRPNYPEALNDIGNTLQDLGRLEEAAESYRRGVALQPELAEIHSNLGTVLRDIGKLDEALPSFRRAVQFNPGMAELHNNLGNALQESGRFGEAVASFRQALAIKPDFAAVHNNLGKTLRDLGQIDDARASVERALEIDPAYAEAHLNRAYLFLQDGAFAPGWREYEYRWKVKESERPREFAQPLWLGQVDLSGKSILLHAEQGFGDTIQFVRYASLLIGRAATVYLEVPFALKSLLENSIDGIVILASGTPLPPFDFHCPLLSLPLACESMQPTIPASGPYLRADPTLVAYWKRKLDQFNALRVGVAWAGSPRRDQPAAHAVDRMRSLAFASLHPLLQVPGVDFFSLQVGGDAAAQLRGAPQVIDFTAGLYDFQDTAALIQNLDLVICVDTSVAHLAAALGKPVWMLNRFNTCWRWLTEREDSAWYPTLRLFRQPSLGDWDSVIRNVKKALEEIGADRRAI